MGNRSKTVFASAFACALGMAAIGCNNNSTPTIQEYNVSFTSNDCALTSTIAKVKSDEDLSLSFSLKSEAVNRGLRLPDPEIDNETVKVTTGNAILSVNNGYEYSINEDVATLKIPHHSYAGDISVNVTAAKLYSLSSDKLNIDSVTTSEGYTKVIINGSNGYRAPDNLVEVRIDQIPCDEYSYEYLEKTTKGELTIATDLVKEAKLVDITLIPANDDSQTIPVYFYADEITWGRRILLPSGETMFFPNRPQLANMFAGEENPTEIVAPAEDYDVHDEIQLPRGKHLDANIELADYNIVEVGEEIISPVFQKNYHYSHELPHGPDREGITKGLKVLGILADGTPVEIPSNHYVYTPSDDYKSAFFFLDSYWITDDFARIEIYSEIEQVANNVLVELNENDQKDVVFDRHCYRYDSAALGEDDFLGKIELINDPLYERRLPKDYIGEEPPVEENSRLSLEIRNDFDPENPIEEFDYQDGYTYAVTDGIARHHATLAIDRDSIPHDALTILPYDIVLKLQAVDSFEVVQEGDLKHVGFDYDTDLLYQDEDLDITLRLYSSEDDEDSTTDYDRYNDSMYDYEGTFDLPHSMNEIDIWGVDVNGEEFPISGEGVTYEEDPEAEYYADGRERWTLHIPNALIDNAVEVHVEAYANRTHFLASPIWDNTLDYYSSYIQYTEADGDTYTVDVYDDFLDDDIRYLYIDVGDVVEDVLSADVELTEYALNEKMKLTDYSVSDANYYYFGNDMYPDYERTPILDDDNPRLDLHYINDNEYMRFVVDDPTTEPYHYKDSGTIDVIAPTDTCNPTHDPQVHFPSYNEDMEIWFTAEPDSLVHEIVVSDGNPSIIDNHYEIPETTAGGGAGVVMYNADGEITGEKAPYYYDGTWYWEEPLDLNGYTFTDELGSHSDVVMKITIILKDEYADWTIDQSMATEAYVELEDRDPVTRKHIEVALDSYVDLVGWNKDPVNRIVTCYIQKPKDGPVDDPYYYQLKIAGRLRIDLWSPEPPEL